MNSIRKSFRQKSKSILGEGSFGTSHKVVKDNAVVVKKISVVSTDQEMDTFCQEYQRLGNSLKEKIYFARLHSVNLTTRKGQSRLECVTEFMEYNLPSFINREDTAPKIFVEDISRITRQVAKALNFLHDPEQGTIIVHRHLTPNNILIKIEETGKLRAMIADAGLAQTFEKSFASMKITVDEDRYMAPEIHGNICNQRMADKFSPAVDVFSLGIISLEMCIGQPPEPLLTSQQVQSDLQNMDDHHPLKGLLLSCLQVNPDDRISALEVARRLKRDENFKNDVIRYDIQEMKKVLVSHYDVWKAVRARTIENIQERDLEDVIKNLNKVHRNVGIAKASSSTAALIGGGIALGGFIASFFTAGIAIPVMIAGAAMAATGGLFTAGSQATGKVISRAQLKNIRGDIADDILESQSLRKDFDKFDALFERNFERYISQDQERQDEEIYGCLKNVLDLPNFDDFMLSNNMKVGGIRSVFSAFTAASLTTNVGVQGTRLATAAFQTLSVAGRAAHLLGGIMSAISIPIDIYFIYTSIDELKKESESEAAKAIQELNEGMVLNERSSKDFVEDYINMKVHTLIRERQHQRQIHQNEAQEHDEGEQNIGGLTMIGIEKMAGPEDYEGFYVGNSCFYA
ncbi:uncharacterized protein LOC116292950 [Actinia tenebrosa]|uniref:Uncharacterized protein LOC116292950 n=1 Tax=Actinia tenebrosa TaxID=6105 RepID=A0A6P8HTY9_ACTTE|nr:uncharacterized protein LOC116292950 [Actinia tenebrosa]